MHWILQNNLFDEAAYQDLLDTLVRFNIQNSIHKVIPFVGELTPEPILDHGNVICMGSYSMRHYAKKRGWKPGVFDLEPFDFRVQLEKWGTEMLNHDSVVTRFEDADFTDRSPHFVRPIHDSKSFAGRVFDYDEFWDWKRKVCVLEHDYGDSLSKDTLIQVCRPKEIYSEHRFWVVKSKVVTCSTYKIGSRVVYKPENEVDQRFKDYVEVHAAGRPMNISSWEPHEAFVIDVADTSEGIKIVEINTLNSAGFYKANMQKLVMALEEAFHTRRI